MHIVAYITHARLDEIDGPPSFTYVVRGACGLLGARPLNWAQSTTDPVTSTIRESDNFC